MREYRSVASLLLLVAGLACLIVALLLLPRPLAAWQVFAALAVAFGLASLHLALARIARSGSVTGNLEARSGRDLEQLQDVRWELSENEARYRALLDSQGAPSFGATRRAI